MAWSKYQNKIFEYATNPNNGSFVISAVAGSGKTTTIVECAKRIASENPNLRILFLAFNKSIVEHLKEETGTLSNMTCKTLHSYGAGVLYRSKMKFCLNENKWKNYIKSNASKMLKKELPQKKFWLYVKNCETLLNMCRINLIDGSSLSDIEKIAYTYSVRTIENEVEAVSGMLKKTSRLIQFKTKNGYEIDYYDMICLPLTDSFRKFIYKYDIVFIDEAQDLSKAQQQLMLQAIKPGGKFIGCGDISQSISGFAGSLTDSFNQLVDLAGGMSLPLSVNYRCGKKIIELAQKIVPEIEAYEGSPEGEIIHQNDLKDAAPGDMIICRKTAPLIRVVLRFMANSKSAYIKGKDIAEDMKALIEKVSGNDDNGISLVSLYARLDNLIEKTRQDLIDNGAYNVETHPVLQAMIDKVNSIRIIGQNCHGVGDILELLDKIFDDTVRGDAIMLSTVHKAKGLENDKVYIICPELLPMRMPGQQDWELKQEMNLKYVAITRAKTKLVWVDVDEHNIKYIDVV